MRREHASRTTERASSEASANSETETPPDEVDRPTFRIHLQRELAIGLALAACLIFGGDRASAQVEPGATSLAFAVPSSNLVFKAVISLPPAEATETGGTSSEPATRVTVKAREGSLIVLDPTPDDPDGRIGLVLTLDRTGSSAGQEGKAVVLHPYAIEPHPDGGEQMERLEVLSGPYKDEINVQFTAVPFTVVVDGDRFEDFDDSALITQIWAAVERNPNALDGMYESLYSLYGPTANACTICDGVLVCATGEPTCGDGGGGWNNT